MLANLAAAARSFVTRYPDTPEVVTKAVQKAVKWVKAQTWLPDLYKLWDQTSFNVNFGAFPELGNSGFEVVKSAGDRQVFGVSRGRKFVLTVDGFVKAAKAKAGRVSAEQTAKVDAAKAKVAAAKAAAEAAQAELAAAEAAAKATNTYSFGL